MADDESVKKQYMMKMKVTTFLDKPVSQIVDTMSKAWELAEKLWDKHHVRILAEPIKTLIKEGE